MRRSAVLLLSILVGAPSSTTAQARRGSVEVRAGMALGIASTSVGGRSSTEAGPLFNGQFGLVLSSRTDITADFIVQPYKAQNPVADEGFAAIYSLLGAQIGLGGLYRTYLRPELGVVFRSWSGTEVFVSSETGLVAGVAVGREIPLGPTLGLTPEVFVRVSGADELSTPLFGLAISVIPVGARTRTR